MADTPMSLPKEAGVPVTNGGGPTVSQAPVPDIRHLEQKELLERLAQMTRERQDEHQKFNRALQAAQTQAKVDIERLRATTANHVRDLESQNSALMKSLARLQGDVDRLERENLTLRVQAGNHEVAAPPGAGTAPAGHAA